MKFTLKHDPGFWTFYKDPVTIRRLKRSVDTAYGRAATGAACLFALSLILSGCGRCNYEERHVTGFNSVIENGELIVRAELRSAELRGALQLKTLDLSLTGSLKGHVTSILLLDPANPSAQFAIPIDPPSSTSISSGSLVQRPGDVSPNLEGVYAMIASNGAVLQITTDLPSRPSLTVSLTVTDKQNWYRPDNCY